MKSTRNALLMSLLALLLCMSMLVGTTFAWFTDSVTSNNNIITSGNLDLGVEYLDADGNWEEVSEETKLFPDDILWEPGHTEVVYLRASNLGSLAFKYRLGVNIVEEKLSTNAQGAPLRLSDYIYFGVVEGVSTPYADRETARAAVTTPEKISAGYRKDGSILADGEDQYFALVVFMPETVGNEANHAKGAEQPAITLGVNVFATQDTFESDSFGNDYDAGAQFPEFEGNFKATADIIGKVDADNKLTEDITVGNAGGINAVVPAGTLIADGVEELVLSIDTTNRSKNIEMVRGQVSRSFDVHIEGISEDNTVPATIELGAVMPTGLKASSVEIWHVEDGTPNKMTAVDVLTDHNQFVYNAETGEMTVSMATFSEVTAVVAAGDPWSGTFDTSWYNTTDTEFTITTEEQFAGFGAIVGGMVEGIEIDDFSGKTVKLGADLDLGGALGGEDDGTRKVWYPIGYHNGTESYNKVSGGEVTSDVSSFEGTFDGQGHTISNIYQNTWDMFGDYNSGYEGTPNHYKDGMGIFGFVYNGTVKNLNVNNFQSDGEFCTTGVVAAYASGTSTFENITVTNSNPRAYNVPNGGVVGYAYDEEGATNVINFNNVNVDSSNKITALWGSWDVGCGGILGRVNGDTTVNMTNCEVGAVIDVFNDVCGNYQYYQYRYSGMLIGTVGPDGDPQSGPEKVNFNGVTVYVGDWADYYYCEFEKNSQGSYTDDFQFSRVERGEIVFNEYNMPTECTHEHTVNEDKLALFLPFNQLYTGYGWGASPVKSASGVEIVDHFYSITYLDADGTFIAVEYVTDGQNDETHNVANAKAIPKTVNETTVDGWVDAYSVPTSTIKAGNRRDIVLYATYDDKYTARWIDETGNVIHTETVKKNTTSLPDVAGPASSSDALIFDHWEVRNTDGTYVALSEYNFKNINGDITITPNYALANVGEAGTIGLAAGPDENGDGRPDYYTVEAASGLSGEVTIPGYVNGVPVTVITDLSKDTLNTEITSVIIKDGVQEIGSQALAMTSSLKKVTIPASVTSIGSNAFASGIGGGFTDLFGVGKVVEITYAGTWEQWLKICENGWDSGLAKDSTVICTSADGSKVTYKKTSRAWNSGENEWEKQ